MEANAGSMAFLYKKITELRKLGETWGLSPDEIDKCLFDASPVQLTDTTSATWIYQKATRRHLTYLGCLVCPILFLILINTSVVDVAVDVLPPKTSQDLLYVVMRFYRQMVTYFPSHVHFADKYNDVCIVFNPLWENPVAADCQICDSLKSVKQFKQPVKTMKAFLFGYVVVHRRIMPKSVRLEELVSLIKSNTEAIGNRIRSTVTWVKTPLDLAVDNLEEKIVHEKDFRAVWDSQNFLFDGQLMRKLFPRPTIFPNEVESSTVKYLFLDGPHSSEYMLPEGSSGEFCWFAQGKGSKTLLFTPLKQCNDKCYSFLITMNEGDVLTFPVGGWHIKSLVNGRQISISYVSHLSLLQ